jgi:hypothetical protein
VQPGPIDTDTNPATGEWAVPQKAFTALGRYGHVDEVAALVAFVAGPESSYITGANLNVDGGMIAWTNARKVTLRISARLILQDREAVSNARSAETINTQ